MLHLLPWQNAWTSLKQNTEENIVYSCVQVENCGSFHPQKLAVNLYAGERENQHSTEESLESLPNLYSAL